MRGDAGERFPLVPTLVATALISAAVVTLGAPLVPEIQAKFGVSEESAQWSYTITLLVGATCTPLLGRLADGGLRRPATIAVSGLVAAGCALSGLAPSFAVFIAGRSLQGLAVALVAMTIATARDHVAPARVPGMVALLSVTTAMGAGISYPLTTWVTETFGLAVAFVGAAVLSVLVTVAGCVGLPRASGPPRRRGVDVGGAVLLITGSAAGLLALSQGNAWGWLDPRVLALAGVCVCALSSWWWVELRVTAPLVDLRLLRHRNVMAANLAAVLMGVSLYSLPVLISRMGQAPHATGYGAALGLTTIGLVMIAIAPGNLIGSWAAAILTAAVGPRFVLAAGGLLACAGPVVLIAGEGQVWVLVASITVSSLGSGATFGTMPNLIVAAVEPSDTGSATSFNLLLRAVGGALGSAGTAAVLGAHPGTLPGFATESGVNLALGLCAGACLASVIVSLTVPERRDRGAERSAGVRAGRSRPLPDAGSQVPSSQPVAIATGTRGD
jgi:predicted MFS family arabinose efflux permease